MVLCCHYDKSFDMVTCSPCMTELNHPWTGCIPVILSLPVLFQRAADFQSTNWAEQTERSVARSRTRSSGRLFYSIQDKKTHWSITDRDTAVCDCVFTYRPIYSTDMSRHTRTDTQAVKPLPADLHTILVCLLVNRNQTKTTMQKCITFLCRSGANKPNYRWENTWSLRQRYFV